MKSNIFEADQYSLFSREREGSTEDSSSIEIKEDKNYILLNKKTLSYLFPLIYFFSSTLFLLLILMVNVFKDHTIKNNLKHFPLHPFPGFYSLKEIQPQIYTATVLIICISGFLNVWFFCSLLLQRFSVPELRQNKITVHLMFILGIFANLIFVFFGFSYELLHIETSKIKVIQISLSMIIFLSFVFFNIFFATLTLNVFENFKRIIAYNDNRLRRNIKFKKYVVYLAVFIITVYIISIFLNYHLKTNKPTLKYMKKHHRNILLFLETLLFAIPYALFVINAILNLMYYHDIRYIEDIINIVIDREFFLTSDESSNLLSQYPL